GAGLTSPQARAGATVSAAPAPHGDVGVLACSAGPEEALRGPVAPQRGVEERDRQETGDLLLPVRRHRWVDRRELAWWRADARTAADALRPLVGERRDREVAADRAQQDLAPETVEVHGLIEPARDTDEPDV